MRITKTRHLDKKKQGMILFLTWNPKSNEKNSLMQSVTMQETFCMNSETMQESRDLFPLITAKA